MQIVRKYLSPDEVSPPGLRYDPDCDCVQVSPDGGTTWTDDPGADPRHNPAYLLPARTGGTARCDSAESAMQHFKSLVDGFIAGGTILGVVNLWVGLLFFIPGVNVLIALLLSIAEALFDTGVVVVDAAMTDPVYDQIKCILFCHMDDDGQVSAEQFTAINDEISSMIGGVPATVWSLVTSAWGEVGLSNAGASGEYTGDCDDCDCGWCHYFDFTASDFSFAPYGGLSIFGTYVPGSGFLAHRQNDSCTNHNYNAPESNYETPSAGARYVKVWFSIPLASVTFGAVFTLSGVQQYDFVMTLAMDGLSAEGSTGSGSTSNNFYVGSNNCGISTDWYITALEISGFDDDPFPSAPECA